MYQKNETEEPPLMIGRIVIENYKSIESLSLDLGRVTVLIGANGSGKSNILEAIALCSAAAANKLDNEFLFSRGIRVSDDPRHMRSAFSTKLSSENILLKAYSEPAAPEIPIFDCELSFVETIDGQEWKNITFDKFLRRSFEDVKSRKILTAEREGVDDLFSDIMTQLFYRGFNKKTKSEGLADFLIFAPENYFLRRFEDEGQIRPLGVRGEGLFKLLTVLARETEPEEGHDKTRLAEIQERLGLLDWFGDFQIGGNVALGERTLRIRDQYLDGDLAYFTQRSANEGFLFLLFYFTLFVAKETPRFFAIDNIDASLNPKLCAELLRQLTELAEKYDKQVILTTHNPAVLDGLNLRDENQKLYVVERDLDGRTQARRIPPPRPPEKHEEPVPLSEAFLRGYIGGLPKNF